MQVTQHKTRKASAVAAGEETARLTWSGGPTSLSSPETPAQDGGRGGSPEWPVRSWGGQEDGRFWVEGDSGAGQGNVESSLRLGENTQRFQGEWLREGGREEAGIKQNVKERDVRGRN